jgi:hypothetical protein
MMASEPATTRNVCIENLRQTMSGQSLRVKKLFVYGGYVTAAAREKQDVKAGGRQVNRES